MAENMNKEVKNTRPPVVVVLGHVDHGKTKLLDTIRKTRIAEKESGGITQHIGAYQAEVSPSTGSGPKKLVTFLDTPGHEAFSAIRSRGAKVADIAILVVAADESVKPQTKEAIKIIKSEKIPFVVAVNKIDKEGANVQKVKQDLATEEVLVEEWGGKIPIVEISAKSGQGINELLEMVLLVADLEDLKEDLSAPAKGVIIESNLDKRRGYVATVLIQKGILEVGDWIVAGTLVGKIKAMEDFMGASLVGARPSQPVRIIGWPNSPEIGIEFVSAETKEDAVKVSEDNVNLAPLLSFFAYSPEISDSPRFGEAGKKVILNLVLKSDVTSSLEAIDNVLKTIKSDEVGYRVIDYDIGNISEADVATAIAGKGQVVGFRVAVDEATKKLAEKEGIKITKFDIIYELIEYVRGQMAELLGPVITRIPLGKVKIIATFKKDAKFQVVGGKILSGKAARGAFVDVFRNDSIVCNGKIGQLQHNKEDMPEVKEGLEAGIRLDPLPTQPFGEVKVGDIIEIYEEQKTKRTI